MAPFPRLQHKETQTDKFRGQQSCPRKTRIVIWNTSVKAQLDFFTQPRDFLKILGIAAKGHFLRDIESTIFNSGQRTSCILRLASFSLTLIIVFIITSITLSYRDLATSMLRRQRRALRAFPQYQNINIDLQQVYLLQLEAQKDKTLTFICEYFRHHGRIKH